MTISEILDPKTSDVQAQGFWMNSKGESIFHTKAPAGLCVEKAERDARLHARKIGVNIDDLLNNAAAHFTNDLPSIPIAGQTPDEVIDSIVESELSEIDNF